jgi:protein SCO1/2
MQTSKVIKSGSLVALVCALMVVGLQGCSEKKAEFKSVDITGVNYANQFTLLDASGKERKLTDFAGKVVVVFFGFTQCPDVCPTSMMELAQVKKLLGKDGDRLQGIFISVDPERDTPEVLKAYMENFDPSFVALYTTPDKLSDLAKDFKVYYKKVEGKTTTSYTIDHTAGSYIYDPQGRLRLFTRHASGADTLAADIAILLKQGG